MCTTNIGRCYAEKERDAVNRTGWVWALRSALALILALPLKPRPFHS